MNVRTEELVAQLAGRLLDAEADRQPIPCLTDEYPQLSAEEAYRIQLELVHRKEAVGDPVIGKKAGLTSLAKQQSMGVFEPILGHLTRSMLLGLEQPLQAAALIHPKVEPEIGFLLGKELRGPGLTVAHVLAATEAVFPAFEILDSRFQGFKFRAADVIADNASSARLLVGGSLISPKQLDLRLVGCVFEKNGQLIETAAGAAVLGHPAAAVAWLANKLAAWGGLLQAGEIVLPGSPVAAADVAPGDFLTVTFAGLGSLNLRCL